jgi:hypothetical protein
MTHAVADIWIHVILVAHALQYDTVLGIRKKSEKTPYFNVLVNFRQFHHDIRKHLPKNTVPIVTSIHFLGREVRTLYFANRRRQK